MSDEEAPKWVTPLSSFKPGDWRTPTLKDMELPEDRVDDEDYSLVFVPEDSWAKLIHWCSTTKQHLKIGPSMHTTELAERIMGPAVWLNNHNSYIEFKKDRKKFRVEGLLHKYGIGELPAHRQTRLVWDLDVNRMYVPLLVNGNHWISMCANFVTRSLEVFDCGGLKHNKDLEPFAHLIPRIVNDVQSSEKRGFTVKPYDVTYAPMPLFLNKTSGDCGVCALKHTEAHLLGMGLTLVNDDNIREARHKIGYDLWEAANDLELFREWEKLFLQRLQLLLRCWCGKGVVTYVSKTEENPYRRFFRCEIGLQDLEPFAHLIPRIVKAVQSSEKRRFTVKPYDVTYAPMPLSLNKTSSDCGVYALKHIEAHLLGMDLTLVNDDNIREASQKISYDLWEAANDPELISRMGKFIPPKATTSPTVEIL
ncbi:hypothetical protein DY000_02013472 [Brassica cretica]|uniref:Ubiquitin-like protease family profile domain-containing protein n=1 Tax=Brassica cretica TaxID=69181 RepID=A0ABQ7CQL7_BRACR|nr:hypothetical protein DY000_02013472 [Brassica cretica]